MCIYGKKKVNQIYVCMYICTNDCAWNLIWIEITSHRFASGIVLFDETEGVPLVIQKRKGRKLLLLSHIVVFKLIRLFFW